MVKGFSRQKSVNQRSFADIPTADIPRSNFKRNMTIKTAFDSAYLIPVLVDEVLPGDSFNVNLTAVARLATPIVPFMDNLFVDFFFFFVPNRLIWNNWYKFMGGQDDPGDSVDYTIPQIVSHAANGWTVSSIGDYFGLPTGITSLSTNSLHFRAYNLIWNEWFRDQNLQDSVVVDKDDGPDTESDYVLLKRGKRHDYFTSCLPWPQKGDAIELPIGSTADIITGSDRTYDATNTTGFRLWRATTGAPLGSSAVLAQDTGGHIETNSTAASIDGVHYQPANLYADLSNATASTINEIREAFQLQKLLERDARSGTRYTEIIASHFRVESPDGRLQRPEYLGGGTAPINISPVAQTSESATTKLGTLAAVGYATKGGIGFTKSFVEHGVILGLANCRASQNCYQQGIHRMWSRSTKYDFYWPALCSLGEQEVLNREIWADGSANDDLVFGYNERWSDYRYAKSMVTGILRSDAASNIDEWHLGIDFATLPLLNAAFIQDAPPVSRVVAVPSEPEIILDGFYNMICTRPMPTYSVPGMIDHF